VSVYAIRFPGVPARRVGAVRGARRPVDSRPGTPLEPVDAAVHDGAGHAGAVVSTPGQVTGEATISRTQQGQTQQSRHDAAVAPAAWVPPTWDEIVREHSGRVYRLAFRLTGNRHDAEDLTQEVFVRVFRSLNSYSPGTFEGWLHRITTNLVLDQVRRKQRIRFDALPEDAADRLAGSDPGPERTWEHNNLDYDIQRALDSLAPDFRAAVVLCDIEGLSYEEIAATLGIKLGTVRSRIHRGRAQLRDALAHLGSPTAASYAAGGGSPAQVREPVQEGRR
jgi:RNA polymerase sigma-70 factor (ECF subfamily)